MRRQAAGDLAGAVICLFAHQLLSLDQLGLIRLAPGRTGRQYVRALARSRFRSTPWAPLSVCSRMFITGGDAHRAAFESVWRRAQAFEERRRAAGASR